MSVQPLLDMEMDPSLNVQINPFKEATKNILGQAK